MSFLDSGQAAWTRSRLAVWCQLPWPVATPVYFAAGPQRSLEMPGRSPGEALLLAALKGRFVLGTLLGIRVTGQTRHVLPLRAPPFRPDTSLCSTGRGWESEAVVLSLWNPRLLVGTDVGPDALRKSAGFGGAGAGPLLRGAWAGLRLRAFQMGFIPAS